jgi:hypothetical protein
MRHGLKFILLGAVSAAVICSSASGQTTLRYKFADGQKLQYVIEQKITTIRSTGNMEAKEEMNLSMELAWNVISVNRDGSAQVQFKVTHAKMSLANAAGTVEADSAQKNEPDETVGKALSQMVKARAAVDMTGTMLGTGELKDVKISEKTIETIKKISGGDNFNPDSLKSMVSNFVFPTDAVSKGKTWTNKSEVKTPIFTSIAENTFTYDGMVQKDGLALEKISIKPDWKIEPAPKSPLKEVKDVNGSGQFFFENKAGRIIEAVVNHNMQMQFTIGNTDVNQKTDETTTMRLKK